MTHNIRWLAALAGVLLLPCAARVRADEALHWTPPSSDARDLEGVWLPGGLPTPPPAAADSGGNAAPPTEIGRLNAPAGAPGGPGGGPPPGAAAAQPSGSTLECTPVQRLGGAGGGMSNLWIGGPHEIVLISEEDMDIRKIYLNATHPPHVKPQPNGHSVGHWDGDTLVVDSVAFAKADGGDAGEHVVERIRKQGNFLIDEATIETPAGTRHQTFRSTWRSDLHVSENVCEENYSRFHFHNGELVDQTQ